jgi:hypothetical protein
LKKEENLHIVPAGFEGHSRDTKSVQFEEARQEWPNSLSAPQLDGRFDECVAQGRLTATISRTFRRPNRGTTQGGGHLNIGNWKIENAEIF